MGALIRIELNKALHARLTWLAFAVGVGLAVASGVYGVVSYHVSLGPILRFIDSTYQSPYGMSSFTYWIASGFSGSVPIPNLFFLLSPLIIGLGYSWSLHAELSSGYAQQLLLRESRVRYYGAKFVVTFLVGALTIAVPFIVNMVIVSCFIPAYQPEAEDSLYIGMYDKTMLSQLYFRMPWAYVAARIGIAFGLAGLWAVVVLGISLFIRNRVAVIVLPFVVLLVIKYVSERIFGNLEWGASLTIIDHLRADGDSIIYGWPVLVGGAVVMLLAALVMPLLAKKRDVL